MARNLPDSKQLGNWVENSLRAAPVQVCSHRRRSVFHLAAFIASLNLAGYVHAATPAPAARADSQCKLLAGDPLIFDKQGEESARTVQAACIREAVSKSIKVELTNAVIAGRLDLAQITAERPIILKGCSARERPDFSYATFKNRVLFSHCSLGSGADFHNAIFERDVSFEGTEFQGESANFVDVLFQGTFDGTGLHFLPESRADFMRASFARTAQFRDAVFEAEANFASVRFRGQSLFQNVLFKKEAIFLNLLAEGDISFRASIDGSQKSVPGARFEGDADFSGGRFLSSVEFEGTTFKGKLNFSSAEIRANAAFGHEAEHGIPAPVLEGDVDFSHTHFGKSADFAGTVFKARARFTSVKIEHFAAFSGFGKERLTGEKKEPAYVHGARFEGDADFSGAAIGAEAQFQDAVFRQKAIFFSARIGGAAGFSAVPDEKMAAALFEGEADFSYVQIGGPAYFQGAVFKGLARFNDIKIRGGAFFRAEVDPNQPDLVRTPGAHFEKEAIFIVAQVGGAAEFQGAKFGGDANFYRARFEGNVGFFAVKKYEVPTVFAGEAIFEDAYIGGNATFNGAIFEKKAQFAGAQLNSVAFFHSDQTTGPTAFHGVADFRETRFGGNASFSNTVFDQFATFDHSHCDALLDFDGAVFRNELSLHEAVVRVLHFSGNGQGAGGAPGEKQFQGSVDLRGCAYDRLYKQVNSETNWSSLTARFYPYDRQPYRQLEKAFRAAGQDEMADKVFLEQQNKELGLKWDNGDFDGWFFKWLHKILFNFGVRPYRLLAFALVFLLLGWWVFWQRGALEKKEDGAPARVSWIDAAGVALRYFFPIDVVIGSRFRASHKKVYLFRARPTQKSWLGISPTFYATILQLAGWILIPLSLAALGGFLKIM